MKTLCEKKMHISASVYSKLNQKKSSYFHSFISLGILV